MILLGLGANLASPAGTPEETLRAVLKIFPAHKIYVQKISSFYHSAPVPVSDQPWFVNAVASVHTELSPENLIAELHDIEKKFGRERSDKNAARTLDLDILDFEGKIFSSPLLTLPHPRLHERAFTLLPMQEIFPDWHHPLLKKNISELVAALPAGQSIIKKSS